MASFDATGVPHCTIDFPLEISPEEIGSLSKPVNTLLKSSYLLGATFEIDAIFNSLFDIAEEISEWRHAVSCLASKATPHPGRSASARRIVIHPSPDRLPFLIAPGAIAARFGKAVSLDPDWVSGPPLSARRGHPVPWWHSPCIATATSPARLSSESVARTLSHRCR